MAILTTGNSYSDGNQITSSNLNAVVNSATFDDPVDTSSGLNLTSDSPPKIAINTSLSNKVLTGGSLNNCPVGAVTPSTGAFSTLSASGVVSVPDGSESAPAITNTGDTNTGIYFPAANSVALTAGANATLTSTNTAITIDVPTSIVSTAQSDLTLQGGDANSKNLIFKKASAQQGKISAVGDELKFYAGTSATDSLEITATASNVKGTLLVGSDDTTPNGMIKVYGGGAAQDEGGEIQLLTAADYDGTYNHYRLDAFQDYLRIGREGEVDITLNSSGNVGIGTTAPAKKLHIASDANGQTTADIPGIRIENTDTTALDTNVSGEIEFFSKDASEADKISGFIKNVAEDAGTKYALTFGSKATGANATEAMRIDANGNVGIGTAAPAEKLEVAGNAMLDASSANLKIKQGTSGTTGGMYFTFSSDSTLYAGMEFVYDTRTTVGPRFYSQNGYDLTVDSGDDLHIQTDSTDRITVLNAGNVGIGATTPAHKLEVNGDAVIGDDTTGNVKINSISGDSAVGSGNVHYTFNGNEGTGLRRVAANTLALDTASTERLRIDSSGDVGIGASPSYKLDVNGTGRFVNNLTLDENLVHNLTGAGSLPGYSAGTFGAVLEDGGANGSTLYMSRKNSWAMYLATDTTLNAQSDKVVQFADLNGQSGDQDNVTGSITITASATAFNTSSDYRLKENEVDITDGIDRLKELKPYRFNFTRDPSTTVDGFFAHEVSPVVPESINGDKDAVDEEGRPDYQGIDQSKLVPLLTAALQEAVAKIEALEARVQTLEG